MKIDFLIISGILVLMCFFPFILFPMIRRKEEKKLYNTFKEEALKLGLNMSFELCWNSNIAGIDILKKHFLLVQKPDNNFIIQHVKLNRVNQIKLLPQHIKIRQQKKTEEILSRIDLEFYEIYSPVPFTVNLFDHDLTYTQDWEMKNAHKLVAELQKYLVVQPVLKRTA